jgi:hypothetical protein
MARKRAKPEEDAREEVERFADSEMETSPLDGEVVESKHEVDPENEVTDITDTILPTHLSEEEINKLKEKN